MNCQIQTKRQRVSGGILFVVVLVGGVVGLFAESARAEGTQFQLNGRDLGVQVDTRWAGGSHGGYYPIRIQVVNRGKPRNLTFRFEGDEPDIPTVRRSVGVEQNARVQFSLSVPMVGRGASGVLSVEQDGRAIKGLQRDISLANIDDSGIDRPAFLVISPAPVDFTPFENAVTSRFGGTGGHTYSYSPWGGGYSSASRSEDHQQIPPLNLPDSWIDYTGLDIVAIPLATLAKIDSDSRQALIHWTESGGTLLVYDVKTPVGKAKDLARLLGLSSREGAGGDWAMADPTRRRTVQMIQTDQYGNAINVGSVVGAIKGDQFNIAAQLLQLDEQYQTDPEVIKKAVLAEIARLGIAVDGEKSAGFVWAGTRQAFASRRLLQGQVFAFTDNPFPGSPHDWNWFLETLGNDRFQWTQRNGLSARHQDESFLQFLIPGVKGVPVYAFLILITLFTVLIGPLNYFFLKGRKQLYILVVSIPAIAFLTSIMLFGYSAVAHGFGIKSRIRSVTVLDQRSKTALTTSRVAMFAGMAPSSGLQFSPETAVYPLWAEEQTFRGGSVDWTDTQSFQGSWLRSRTRTQFVTVTHRRERGRVEFESPANGKMAVSNGLEWKIEMLVAADEKGNLYVARNIPAGGSTRMQRATNDDFESLSKLLRRHPLEMPENVTNGRTQLFDMNPYRYMDGQQRSISYSGNQIERSIDQLRGLASRPEALDGRYLAVLAENPDVEIGVEETTERAGYHLLIGYYR
jgi:hypothetical protein